MSVLPKSKCHAPMVWGFVPKGCLDRLPQTTAERGTFFHAPLWRWRFIMVALATPRLEYVPQVNLSRMYLHRAAEALEAGRIFEAGCLLRESVRRQLFAECNWKGCLPAKEAKRRSPMALLCALNEAGHCGYCGFDWTREIIELANKCAHCVPVKPTMLGDAITIWHRAIDADPCGEPKDRPVNNCKGHDYHPLLDDTDDDDTDGEEWKGVSV